MLEPLIQQILALHQIIGDKDLGVVYGVPSTIFQGNYKFRPHVELLFYPPAKKHISSERSQISFRLMKFTSNTINTNEINELKIRIKELFDTTQPLSWHKGKTQYLYYDQDKGYDFRLLAINTAEAKKVITRVMEVQQHSPNWKLLFIKAADEPQIAFPSVPKKEEILGKQVTEPLRRPEIIVSFHRAVLHIHGLSQPIPL